MQEPNHNQKLHFQDCKKSYSYLEIGRNVVEQNGNYDWNIYQVQIWDISQDDVRRFREGLYFDLMYKVNNKNLQIIFLDTRTFRDSLMPSDNIGEKGKERYIPNPDSSLTILGADQLDWLEKKLMLKLIPDY